MHYTFLLLQNISFPVFLYEQGFFCYSMEKIFISLPGSSLFDEVHKMLLMFLWICEKCFNAVKEETKEFLILNVIFHSEWFWEEKFLTMKDNFSFFGKYHFLHVDNNSCRLHLPTQHARTKIPKWGCFFSKNWNIFILGVLDYFFFFTSFPLCSLFDCW